MKPDMASFAEIPTPLAGLVLVQRKRLEDLRGFFSRLFCADELSAVGFTLPIAQITHLQALSTRFPIISSRSCFSPARDGGHHKAPFYGIKPQLRGILQRL